MVRIMYLHRITPSALVCVLSNKVELTNFNYNINRGVTLCDIKLKYEQKRQCCTDAAFPLCTDTDSHWIR